MILPLLNRILYKTNEEIQQIRESAKILALTHGEIANLIRPGVKTKDLDKRAEEFIADHQASPSFKNFHGYPASLCISVNEVVVHGIPNDYELKDGDIISVDCGILYKGFHSDSAYTYPVGEVQPEILNLLKTTKEALYLGIERVKAGGRMGDIGYTIQKHAESNGYSVIRELVGHGIGKSLHESPEVPNYGTQGKGVKLQNGLVIAIEPMINMGKRNIVQEKDGWTIRTIDRKPSAHFEHTVALIDGNCEILTSFEYIEKHIKI